MSIINTLALESNRQIKINFDGGALSSDAGLLLIKEFCIRNYLSCVCCGNISHFLLLYFVFILIMYIFRCHRSIVHVHFRISNVYALEGYSNLCVSDIS